MVRKISHFKDVECAGRILLKKIITKVVMFSMKALCVGKCISFVFKTVIRTKYVKS
jgi:hypothetical protein